MEGERQLKIISPYQSLETSSTTVTQSIHQGEGAWRIESNENGNVWGEPYQYQQTLTWRTLDNNHYDIENNSSMQYPETGETFGESIYYQVEDQTSGALVATIERYEAIFTNPSRSENFTLTSTGRYSIQEQNQDNYQINWTIPIQYQGSSSNLAGEGIIVQSQQDDRNLWQGRITDLTRDTTFVYALDPANIIVLFAARSASKTLTQLFLEYIGVPILGLGITEATTGAVSSIADRTCVYAQDRQPPIINQILLQPNKHQTKTTLQIVAYDPSGWKISRIEADIKLLFIQILDETTFEVVNLSNQEFQGNVKVTLEDKSKIKNAGSGSIWLRLQADTTNPSMIDFVYGKSGADANGGYQEVTLTLYDEDSGMDPDSISVQLYSGKQEVKPSEFFFITRDPFSGPAQYDRAGNLVVKYIIHNSSDQQITINLKVNYVDRAGNPGAYTAQDIKVPGKTK